MIIDTLQNRRLYHAIQPGIQAGLEYLASFDPAVSDGRYPVRGDEVFALVQRYETGPGTEKRFETHRRHVDIQFIVSGRERILHLPFGSLEVETPYDETRDVAFYHDPPASSSVLLQAGDFAIFHPEDAHKPGCMAGARDPVRKVVVKVRLGS